MRSARISLTWNDPSYMRRTNEREALESQWDGGEDISTEDLRQGLRRYRAFFDRLLSL